MGALSPTISAVPLLSQWFDGEPPIGAHWRQGVAVSGQVPGGVAGEAAEGAAVERLELHLVAKRAAFRRGHFTVATQLGTGGVTQRTRQKLMLGGMRTADRLWSLLRAIRGVIQCAQRAATVFVAAGSTDRRVHRVS